MLEYARVSWSTRAIHVCQGGVALPHCCFKGIELPMSRKVLAAAAACVCEKTRLLADVLTLRHTHFNWRRRFNWQKHFKWQRRVTVKLLYTQEGAADNLDGGIMDSSCLFHTHLCCIVSSDEEVDDEDYDEESHHGEALLPCFWRQRSR